jgi:hypothetical protein
MTEIAQFHRRTLTRGDSLGIGERELIGLAEMLLKRPVEDLDVLSVHEHRRLHDALCGVAWCRP